MHFGLRVHAISLLSGEVEEFGPIVDLFPEPFLHSFFSFSEGFVFSKVVQVGEYSHDIGHSVVLQQRKELE